MHEKTGNAILKYYYILITQVFYGLLIKGDLWQIGSNYWKNGSFRSYQKAEPIRICTTHYGQVYFVSVVGSYLAQIDVETGNVTFLNAPTVDQGASRVWSDLTGRLWLTEWNAGTLGMYDPVTKKWEL